MYAAYAKKQVSINAIFVSYFHTLPAPKKLRGMLQKKKCVIYAFFHTQPTLSSRLRHWLRRGWPSSRGVWAWGADLNIAPPCTLISTACSTYSLTELKGSSTALQLLRSCRSCNHVSCAFVLGLKFPTRACTHARVCLCTWVCMLCVQWVCTSRISLSKCVCVCVCVLSVCHCLHVSMDCLCGYVGCAVLVANITITIR